MFAILAHRDFRNLFIAQVSALLGTGLLTVALGLLAFDLAGDDAGAVLGTALSIKMVAYVLISPLAAALTARIPRRVVLVSADVLRAAVAVSLPFIDAVWQIYLLIGLLQAASASFTPTFQALIPDILPDEGAYTRALSLSRLAYDLENLASPALAALLMMVMNYHWLFVGTFLGFVVSAFLVLRTKLPNYRPRQDDADFRTRLTRGGRIYLATPRLRGLLALNLSAASVGAFVIVNTVVIVRGIYGGSNSDVAVAMGAFGAGSMVAALALPRILDDLQDRQVMTIAALMTGILLLAQGAVQMVLGQPPWNVFLMVWCLSGGLYASILTPSGRLLKRSAHPEDRPAVFAAQFALSHACWLLAYPVAGWGGAALGMSSAQFILGLVAVIGALFARRIWPRRDEDILEHSHPGLRSDHPHLQACEGGGRHAHPFVIDDDHPVWPTARQGI